MPTLRTLIHQTQYMDACHITPAHILILKRVSYEGYSGYHKLRNFSFEQRAVQSRILRDSNYQNDSVYDIVGTYRPPYMCRWRLTYPPIGRIRCADWIPDSQCGGGLHGWPWGYGEETCVYPEANHRPLDFCWLVIRARIRDCISLPGKIKFKKGIVVFGAINRDKCHSFIHNSIRMRYPDYHGMPGQVPDLFPFTNTADLFYTCAFPNIDIAAGNTRPIRTDSPRTPLRTPTTW
jgi:hypothetical protein